MNKYSPAPVIKKVLSTSLLLSAIFLLLFFRHPALFTHPEPWAEDMRIFIGQEYEIGFPETALTLYAGYIHLLPRMIAWIAMKFDMSSVMIIMTYTVMFIKMLTFYMLYKSKEITSGFIKFALISYLILQPFVDEIYNNVTNLQWWLIYLMAIVIIKKETSSAGLIFSIIVLILTGMTGVNSVIFAVPCAYLLVKIKTIDSRIKNFVVIVCGLIQFYCLYTSGRSGNGKLMYEGGNWLIDIINLFVNRVIYHTLADFDTKSYINIFVFTIYIFIIIFHLYYYRKQIIINFIFLFSAAYTAVIFYNFLKSSPNLNFISGLLGERYFAYLRVCTLVLAVSSLNLLFKMLLKDNNYKKVMAYTCYLICLVVLKNYSVDHYPFQYQYYNDVEKFKSAESGEVVTFHFPIGWTLDLKKK